MITRILYAWIVIATLAGCGCESSAPPSGVTPPSLSEAARIVSLSPAITRALIDLGLEPSIVGRTPHCPVSNVDIPVVGDLLNINLEQVVRLTPTHILVQPPESGVDENIVRAAKAHGWHVQHWRLNTLDDIERLVLDLPAALFAADTAARKRTTASADALVRRMGEALAVGESPLYRGRTLLVYSTDPPSVFGKDTYLDGILSALGATNATDAKHWVSYSLEDLVRLNPDAIIMIRPGSSPDAVTAMGPLWELGMTATRERRVAALVHPEAFLPSTSVIGVAGELRAILESFEARGP